MCLPTGALETRRRGQRLAREWPAAWHRYLSHGSPYCGLYSSRPHDCLDTSPYGFDSGLGVGFDPNLFLCIKAWPTSVLEPWSSHMYPYHTWIRIRPFYWGRHPRIAGRLSLTAFDLLNTPYVYYDSEQVTIGIFVLYIHLES